MKIMVLIILCMSAFSARAQLPYTVVINEIMADPSPAVGLPGHEWIELFNTGETGVNLLNWRLGDGSSVSGPFPQYTLPPKQYLLICAASARPALEIHGNVLTITSFPSLDNAGEIIYLRTEDGRTMHAVRYSDKWYDNSLKKEGGWTLEMIDARSPCQGMTNWKASVNPSGGTPGRQNSVIGSNPDIKSPVPLRTYSLSDHRIAIVLDEPLDSISAVNITRYKIDNAVTISKAICPSPLFDEVILETEKVLDSQLIYTIQISGIRDCSQNEMESVIALKAGLLSEPATGNIVVNEILFNPRSGGNDYIELLNTGNTIIDASKLYLASINTSGQPGTSTRLTSSTLAIYPGDYTVVTVDAASLARNYLVKDPSRVIEVSSTPSYPDDKGTVVLMDFQGIVLDEVSYDQNWHHKLISDPDGVSLERIDPFGPSASAANWHSAASTAGYGTPGYVNSQYRLSTLPGETIGVAPKVFSPDNDGLDDITRISYKTSVPGFVANVYIFDRSGRQVRHLVRNELLGVEGYWNWNGSNDQLQPLPVGVYIILVDLFDLKGTKHQFRRATVLAKKLR